MKKIIVLFATACIVFSSASAQFELGGEYQHNFGKSYPGNSLGLAYEGFSLTNKTSFNFGVNYKFGSSGASQSAKGGAWGLHAGFRYNFNFNNSGNIYSGVRVGLAFDKDDKGTNSTILMPSLEGGYHHTFNNFSRGGYGSAGIALGYPVSLTSGKESEPSFDEEFIFITRMGVGMRF